MQEDFFKKKLVEHDARFDKHDARFDQHDARFDEHDRRFDRIEKKLFEHDDRFDRIEDRLNGMSTKEDMQKIMTALDQQTVILKRLDHESVSTTSRVDRIERDVDLLKAHTGMV